MGYSGRVVTVLRAHGLRVAIFINDHLPAHVHVFGLLDADGVPSLVWADAMSRGDIRRALRLVVENQAFLLESWEEIHGRAK